MWGKNSNEQDLTKENIIQIMNETLREFNKHKMRDDQVFQLIKDLLELGCIKEIFKNSFRLQEQIKINYEQ
ncbi:hypothetical protein ACFL0M_14960 [Thermodesulfobacteriota bacterium]